MATDSPPETAPTEPAVHLRDCRLQLGTDALFAIADLRVEVGERLAITGPSGCGKSTLLNLISGLLAPDTGDVHVLGEALHRLGPRARDRFRGREIGFVHQTFNLLPHFSAVENVKVGLHFGRGIPKAERTERAHAVIDAVGLTHRANTAAARLSSGERQRVAIARAIANRPRLLLADEPTGALDPANGRAVMDLIRSVCADTGCTFLIVTHDHELAATFPRRFDSRALVGGPNPAGASV